MKLWIEKTQQSSFGANYTLMNDASSITSHYCSDDGFAHSDLFGHPETKQLILDMPYEMFRKIPIEERLDR